MFSRVTADGLAPIEVEILLRLSAKDCNEKRAPMLMGDTLPIASKKIKNAYFLGNENKN